MSDNAHEHTTVSKNGYEVTFHPAFSSRCSVRSHGEGGEEVELYRQEGVHHLPQGQTGPPVRHEIRLRGGELGRDLALSVHDPNHHVARIIVELYGDGHEAGAGAGDTPVETLTVDNDGRTCPPIC